MIVCSVSLHLNSVLHGKPLESSFGGNRLSCTHGNLMFEVYVTGCVVYEHCPTIELFVLLLLSSCITASKQRYETGENSGMID